MMNRRDLVRAVGAAAASSTLGGCPLFVKPMTRFCPNDPAITDPGSPLSIDIHAHIFNGSDLQINAFFSRILMFDKPALRPFGAILQAIAWTTAPTAAQERELLFRISDDLKKCDAGTVQSAFMRDRNAAHQRGVQELKRAASQVEASPRLFSESLTSGLAEQIRALPEDYDAYAELRAQPSPASILGIDFRGAIDFVLRNLQYRYVNAFEYLRQYSTSGVHKTDLMIAHLVDYDWPIAEGRETLSPFYDQFETMKQISILTGGRVQCFAPFDPMKEVAYRLKLPKAKYSPLRLVRDAVLKYGFVGVKIYPSMGFAASGNSNADRYPPSMWDKSWLPASLRRPDMGKLLDDALKDLYAWCAQEDVPIMAHTSPSNVPADDFRKFTDPESWDGVPSGLRVNFGHFGETDGVEKPGRSLAYTKLMTVGEGSHGQRYFADSGYFAEVLTREAELAAFLKNLFHLTKAGPGAALTDRLMYGTDWEMIVVEGRGTGNYLRNFERIFAQFDADPALQARHKVSERFFGINAAEYLGLRSKAEKSTRARLQEFYDRHAVPTPLWMTKVDRIPV